MLVKALVKNKFTSSVEAKNIIMNLNENKYIFIGLHGISEYLRNVNTEMLWIMQNIYFAIVFCSIIKFGLF